MIQRDHRIDFLKGCSLYLVILGHACAGKEYLSLPFNLIYSFHMPLLFFLSGYLLQSLWAVKYAQINRFKFISQKAVSLLLPYLMWTIVMPWIFSGFRYSELIYGLKNATGLYGEGLWFLPVLFGLYAAYVLFDALEALFHRTDSILFDAICYSIVELLLLLLAICTRYPYITNMVSYSIPFFAGVILKKHPAIEKCVTNHYLIPIYAIAYGILFQFFDFTAPNSFTQLLRILLAFFVIGILWSICKKDGSYSNPFAKALLLCGKYSLAIYLVPTIFTRWFSLLTQTESLAAGLLAAIFGTAVTCGICVLLGMLISRIRPLNFILYGKY